MFGLKKNRKKYVKARFWKNSADFTYPEQSLDYMVKKDDLACAFSGGGTRSASATLGQLRALRSIGILEKVRYISAVSGGAWAAIPYTFLPESYSEDDFFGECTLPEKITLEGLKVCPENNFLKCVTHGSIVDDYFKESFKLAGDEVYCRALGNMFLEPYDLNNHRNFITQDSEILKDILRRNPRDDGTCYLKENDFYLPRANRPFFIANSTILTGFISARKFPLQITPFYAGTKNYFENDETIGGGFLETMGYDSKRPESGNQYTVNLKLGSKRHIFSLSDMLGCTGAAPQEMLYKMHIRNIGFPEYRHWSMKPDSGFNDDEELSHGDGGHLDNLGIMPLLARGVKNIIVFVNCKTKFEYNGLESKIASSIPNMFRPHPKDDFDTNVVFDDRNLVQYQRLLSCFNKCSLRSDPLICMDSYKVKANEHYSIEPMDKVNICWIYNQMVPRFYYNLQYPVQKLFRTNQMTHFPHYWTFYENFPKIIALSAVQANLLAHLSSWCVVNKQNAIKNFFGY